MKKLFCVMLCLALCLGTGALAEAGAGLANPWVEATAAEVLEALGVEFGVPEGATDVRYFILPEQELAEMQFTWYGMDYTARIKPADAFEDISGMYFEWDVDTACAVRGCEGRTMRGHDDLMTVDVTLWYDAEAGLMYSVSTGGEDLDGFDILASAEAIYLPSTAE